MAGTCRRPRRLALIHCVSKLDHLYDVILMLLKTRLIREWGALLKISSSKRKYKKLGVVLSLGKHWSSDEDRLIRINRASVYLGATRKQFALDAAAASTRLVGTEGGVLAGPIAPSLSGSED